MSDRPADVEAYNERLLAYYEANPDILVRAYCFMTRMATSRTCYTSTIRMTGTSTRTFTRPTRRPELQEWYTAPLEANAGIWTAPYFDTGGGEIWMITHSVPLRDATGIFALVVTDLAVEAP